MILPDIAIKLIKTKQFLKPDHEGIKIFANNSSIKEELKEKEIKRKSKLKII